MITRHWYQKNLQDAMFPVERKPVFWDDKNGRQFEIKGHYAIIDTERNHTLSVVTDKYRLITNKEAYRLADLIIQGVFEGRTISDFICFNVRLSKTRGSCVIDLIIPHNYLQPFGDVNESWTPFLRITNSYNRKSVLRYEIGFCRWICLNGMIFGKRGFTISVRHNELDLFGDYERIVTQARRSIGTIDSIWKALSGQLIQLRAIRIPFEMVLPLYCRVFDIQVVEDADETRIGNHPMRARRVLQSARQYFDDLGNNAYAFLNVMTDYATFPAHLSEHSVNVNYLQRRVGLWTEEFLAAYSREDFSLEKYIGEEALESGWILEKWANDPYICDETPMV